MRRGVRVLQRDKTFSRVREMRELKSRAPVEQTETLDQRGGCSVGNVWGKVAERAVDSPPKPAGRKLGAGCTLIDGNNPAYFQRFNLACFVRKLSLIVQNFKLRLGNLQAASLPFAFHLAIERHKLAGLETVAQIFAMEPY